ncbi:DUF3290 family protein [Leuconostoc fallax]|uniref:DUF3290 domain-containing protein n=1 Tax=Leuconostoc fallax TaxID=1251 RepID=A0A4R5N960_9LACO|nr:DUF3290 family protein [Leuconostoc fallax]MBU7456447.1 DUF3290 family protein [Leuconostoc fallax]MCO6184104.1 DUF3290 domain-containing protein [Leuconostoc fallax]TDG68486.1 hypothetical protein C5L23_000088 [Leuconostoc fallax]
MTFYSYHYLIKQSTQYTLIQMSFLILIIVSVGISALLWYRHRSDLKYRDLFIIGILAFILLVGMQISEWQTMKSTSSQQSQTTQILKRVAHDQHQPLSRVWTNTRTATNGMLVKIDTKFYQVNLSDDGQSITLTPAITINQKIEYINEVK